MIDLSKYSEKEVCAAVRAFEEIINMEDFNIDIVEDDGEKCFALRDHQGANLGGIESDRFISLGGIIGRMEIYHNDYFYEGFNNRIVVGEEIPQDDCDRKIIIFLENEYCQDLLMAIDVETYQKYKDKTLNEVGLNSGEIERYVSDELLHVDGFDVVSYVIDKAIALKIMGTQSAYPIVEYDNSVYVAAHGDWYENSQEILKDLSAGENSFCNNYSNYGTLIETELYQVKDDMHDLGIFNEFGNWEFYLSKYELEYIGLGDEFDKSQKLDISGLNNDELKDIVDLVDKIENMFESEISEEVYDYISNNEDIFNSIEAEVIKLLPEAIDKYEITTDDIVETCLYNCDALYMEAICNILGDKVVPVKCGHGMIEMKQKNLDSVISDATVKSEVSNKGDSNKICDVYEKE